MRSVGVNKAVANLDIRAQSLKALQMQIDRTRTDGTAARQRNLRPSAAREQRPHNQKRSAHFPHQIVGGLPAYDIAAVHGETMLRLVIGCRDTQFPQHLRDRLHIVQRRNFVKAARLLLPQERRRDNRQHRVLRAADFHTARKTVSAVDNQFLH